MKKGTFSVVIVPHDLEKTRTYRVPYGLFYTFLILFAVGMVTVFIFVMTYGRLLIKARETVMLERQVVELTQRNEQVGEIMRNLARIRNMDSQIRTMLGLNVVDGDSTAVRAVHAGETYSNPAHENEQAQVMRSLPSFWPVRGYMTRGFQIAGGREDQQYHPGIDIGVDRGTPVRSAASGYVVEAGWDDTYGYYIRIDHGYGIKTLYAHNDRLVVMNGERVGRGQTIAYSGNTGKSSAPHLHFEVTQNNTPVDPLIYLLQ